MRVDALEFCGGVGFPQSGVKISNHTLRQMWIVGGLRQESGLATIFWRIAYEKEEEVEQCKGVQLICSEFSSHLSDAFIEYVGVKKGEGTCRCCKPKITNIHSKRGPNPQNSRHPSLMLAVILIG